jgi:hypothetical protein
VGANTDDHRNLGPGGTINAGNVMGLLSLDRFWVTQPVTIFFQTVQHLLGSAKNPDWLATPFNCHSLSGLESGDIRLDRSPRSLRLGTGIPGCHERDCSPNHTNTADSGRRAYQESSPAGVHFAVTHRDLSPNSTENQNVPRHHYLLSVVPAADRTQSPCANDRPDPANMRAQPSITIFQRPQILKKLPWRINNKLGPPPSSFGYKKSACRRHPRQALLDQQTA